MNLLTEYRLSSPRGKSIRFKVMWNLHGCHCEVEENVELDSLEGIVMCIELVPPVSSCCAHLLRRDEESGRGTYVGYMIPILKLTA